MFNKSATVHLIRSDLDYNGIWRIEIDNGNKVLISKELRGSNGRRYLTLVEADLYREYIQKAIEMGMEFTFDEK